MDILSIMVALVHFSFFSFFVIVLSMIRSREMLKQNIELMIGSFSMFISTTFIYLELRSFHTIGEPNVFYIFVAYCFFAFSLFNISNLVSSLYGGKKEVSYYIQIAYSVFVGIMFVVVSLTLSYQIRNVLFVLAFAYPYFLISYRIYKWDEPVWKSPFTYLLIIALFFYLMKVYGVYVLTPEVSYTVESDTDVMFTLLPMISVIVFFTVYFIESNRNVTEDLAASSMELEQTLLQVKKASETDHLTNLANRVKLNRVLHYQYQYYKQLRVPFSIAMIDVDYFKEINDEYGHLVGDSVLECIAEAFKTLFRKNDIIGRWGGDEFMIIFPDTRKEHFEVIQRNIEEAFENKVCTKYKKPISLSIGFACIEDHISLEELIHTADRAMYKHKERE